MSAAASIPYRLAATMCHAIGCLDACGSGGFCARHWNMVSVKHQDAIAQMAPGALRAAMGTIARKERRG